MTITTDPKGIKSGYPDHYDGWGSDMNANLLRTGAMLAETFAYDPVASHDLVFAYRSAFLRNPVTGAFFLTAAGTIALTNNTTNYIEADNSGAVSKNTVGFTATRLPIAQVTTVAGAMTEVLDRRAFLTSGSGGATRSDVILTTAALAYNETATGTIDFGASSLPVRVSSSQKAWFRLYATAADRTADAARLITDDPETPILLELIFQDALTYKLDPVPPMVNADVPATNLLYYSVKFTDPDYGGATLSVHDTPLIWPDSSGGGHTLDDHAFTNPSTSGITLWEFNGVDRDRYQLLNQFMNAIPGVRGPPTGLGPTVARPNGDLGNDKFEAYLDLWRRNDGSDQAALCFFVPNTAIGAWSNDDFYLVRLTRSGAATATLTYEHRAVGGAETVIATVAGIAWPTGSALRLGIRVLGTALQVYTTVGVTETVRMNKVIPDGVQDATHVRFGLHAIGDIGFTGFIMQTFSFATAPLAPVAIDITTERVKLEEVAA